MQIILIFETMIQQILRIIKPALISELKTPKAITFNLILIYPEQTIGRTVFKRKFVKPALF